MDNNLFLIVATNLNQEPSFTMEMDENIARSEFDRKVYDPNHTVGDRFDLIKIDPITGSMDTLATSEWVDSESAPLVS